MAKKIGNHMLAPLSKKVPDLSSLLDKKATSIYLAASLAGKTNLHDLKMTRFFGQIVRLTDKAIVEYETVREYLEEEKANRNKGADTFFIVGIINHLENCIITTQRVLNIFDKIAGGKNKNIVISRADRKLIQSKIRSRAIKNFRDTIEHIDEKILRDEIKNDEFLAPMVVGGGAYIKIARYELKFSELASLLRTLNGLVVKIFA